MFAGDLQVFFLVAMIYNQYFVARTQRLKSATQVALMVADVNYGGEFRHGCTVDGDRGNCSVLSCSNFDIFSSGEQKNAVVGKRRR